MIRLYLILFLGFSLLSNDAQAFFGSSPCKCSTANGRQDGADAYGDYGKRNRAKTNFTNCVRCDKIKKFSEVKGYFSRFLKNLPPEYHEEYIQIVKSHPWPANPAENFGDVMLKFADKAWKYTPERYENLSKGGRVVREAKSKLGIQGQLWAFLYHLGQSLNNTKQGEEKEKDPNAPPPKKILTKSLTAEIGAATYGQSGREIYEKKVRDHLTPQLEMDEAMMRDGSNMVTGDMVMRAQMAQNLGMGGPGGMGMAMMGAERNAQIMQEHGMPPHMMGMGGMGPMGPMGPGPMGPPMGGHPMHAMGMPPGGAPMQPMGMGGPSW